MKNLNTIHKKVVNKKKDWLELDLTGGKPIYGFVYVYTNYGDDYVTPQQYDPNWFQWEIGCKNSFQEEDWEHPLSNRTYGGHVTDKKKVLLKVKVPYVTANGVSIAVKQMDQALIAETNLTRDGGILQPRGTLLRHKGLSSANDAYTAKKYDTETQHEYEQRILAVIVKEFEETLSGKSTPSNYYPSVLTCYAVKLLCEEVAQRLNRGASLISIIAYIKQRLGKALFCWELWLQLYAMTKGAWQIFRLSDYTLADGESIASDLKGNGFEEFCVVVNPTQSNAVDDFWKAQKQGKVIVIDDSVHRNNENKVTKDFYKQTVNKMPYYQQKLITYGEADRGLGTEKKKQIVEGRTQ